MPSPIVLAGQTALNATLYHRVQFNPPDSVVLIDFGDRSILIVRDIEMDRARKEARADEIACAADFEPEGGLSGDRDTALAQAAAECVRQSDSDFVTVDRTFPFLFAHELKQAGIELEYSPELGVLERRTKSAEEIEHLRHAQAVTGEAMTMACRAISRAKPDDDGNLQHEGEVLTSERLRRMITAFLIDRGFSNHHDSIVVTVPHVADCHHFGAGPLKANLPVIVDIFPMDNATRYCGDMTRTAICGEPSEEVVKMHAAVRDAKAAGCEALGPGTTGEAVHRAVAEVIEGRGFSMVRGDARHGLTVPSMRHGTGHGIGLDVHEPILLDDGGGEILQGEVFTVEPGLYSASLGGVRVEDMVVVTENGHEILSPVSETLNWD
ncbi:MAG: aminopeptidase P family protein [Verrucomicrobiales bacterium]|nr:aminopeptidase P family protein [Verrucomicrobiales bacterium]